MDRLTIVTTFSWRKLKRDILAGGYELEIGKGFRIKRLLAILKSHLCDSVNKKYPMDLNWTRVSFPRISIAKFSRN